jgi:hypothetical protein
MKRIFHSLIGLVAFLLCGCVEPISPDMGRNLALAVYCEDPVLTKAPVPGVDNYHENLISWVDFFFYAGENPTGPAVLHTRLVSGETSHADFKVKISQGDVYRLFPLSPDTQTATVFAVANCPRTLVDDESDLSHTSLAELYEEVVASDFTAPANHKQDNFMMSDTSVVSLSVNGRETELVGTGRLDLKRYAGKLTVSVHVADTIKLNTYEKWHPMLEGMEVYLENGVKSVKIGGRDSIAPQYFSFSNNRKRFAYKDPQTDTLDIFFRPSTINEKVYFNTYPMYMYPQKWTEGSDNKSDGSCEPNLKLILPWYCDPDDAHGVISNQKQCYYKVMLPEKFEQEFKRNYWYHLDIDVEILGALTGENAVPISSGSCFIVPWQNQSDTINHESSVGKARFLSVNRDSILLQNVNSVRIPYVTSHPAVIKPNSIRMTRPYYGTKTSGTLGGGTIRKVTSDNDIYPKDSYYLEYNGASFFNSTEDMQQTSTVVLNHPLNNDYTDATFDYSPYTISFTLVHADKVNGGGIERPVVVIQYPGIYIDRHTNSDASTVGGTTPIYTDGKHYNLSSTYWGYAFADGAYKLKPDSSGFTFHAGMQQARWSNRTDDPYNLLTLSADQKEYQWRTVWYTGGSPDLYQIHITVLDNDDFCIGDPRVSAIDNLEYHFDAPQGSKLVSRPSFSVAASLHPEDDGQPSRSLSYYHPTDGSHRTLSMLAPSYRVSSKFSGTEYGKISLEHARYRCASYQEDGFPAGRWRLPTRGEVRFIAQLSANNVFIFLFNNNDIYWSANGAIKISNNTVVNSSDQLALLRCVYDTWYWGEGTEEYDNWRRQDPEWLALPADKQEKELRNKFVWGDRPR